MKFFTFFFEAGEAPGKLEIVKTPLDTALEYARNQFKKYGRDLFSELPNFDENYEFAKKKASLGKTLP